MKEFLNNISLKEANAFFLSAWSLIVLLLITKKIFRKETPIYLKLIPLYIFLIFLQLSIGEYYHFGVPYRNGKENPTNISAYIFIILEYSIFAILLSKFIKLTLIKKYLIFSCILFTIIAIIIWYLNPSFVRIISVTTAIESISVIPFCLYYFFELLIHPPLLKLTMEPSFWITTGILFLFICITPLYLSMEYFKKDTEIQIIDYFGYDLVVFFLAKASFINIKRKNG